MDNSMIEFEEIGPDGIKWRYIVRDGEAFVTGAEGVSASVAVPSVLGGYPVTTLLHAFNGCKTFEAVSIPESVKTIADAAFAGCSGLTSVRIDGPVDLDDYAFANCVGLLSIPENVASIGESAFAGCTGLTSVTIPDGGTYIGDGAFEGCTGLKSVTIPKGVTAIGVAAFKNCSNLTDVEIPDGVTEIWDEAFSGCEALQSVAIPESVRTIADAAFAGCNGVKSVVIPGRFRISSVFPWPGTIQNISIAKGSTKITDWAFDCCVGLRSVTIPDSVTSIGRYAFCLEWNLESISVNLNNPKYCSRNGLLLSKDGKTLIKSFSGKVTIPDGVTRIGNRAFRGCPCCDEEDDMDVLE